MRRAHYVPDTERSADVSRGVANFKLNASADRQFYVHFSDIVDTLNSFFWNCQETTSSSTIFMTWNFYSFGQSYPNANTKANTKANIIRNQIFVLLVAPQVNINCRETESPFERMIEG